MTPTKMTEEMLSSLADAAVDLVSHTPQLRPHARLCFGQLIAGGWLAQIREEPEALIEAFDEVSSTGGGSEEFNAFVVSQVLRGLPGLTFEFAEVLGGAVCGGVKFNQHPVMPEGLCETYLSTSDVYEYTYPARLIWRDGMDLPAESVPGEAKFLATSKVRAM